MKISIDIDEAGIIKNVLNGVDQKDIERQLVVKAQEQIIRSIENKLIVEYQRNHKTSEYNFDTIIEQAMKDRMLKEMKRVFKDWIDRKDCDTDDKVREIVGEYIDEWLNDNEISFSFVHKMKKTK